MSEDKEFLEYESDADILQKKEEAVSALIEACVNWHKVWGQQERPTTPQEEMNARSKVLAAINTFRIAEEEARGL